VSVHAWLLRTEVRHQEGPRKEKPPASGGDILAGDVAGFSRHIEPFGAPGTLRLLRRLPDRLKPIAPDAGYIIAVGHDYANTKKITDLQSKIPQNAGNTEKRRLTEPISSEKQTFEE